MRRYKHSLSHYRLLTADMGNLLPVGVVEVLPGDSFQHRTSAMIRVSPLVAPTMHPVQVRIHHWFVPNRITWDGWEDFITGENSEDPIPTVESSGGGNRTVLDLMGVPPVDNFPVNALPIRAYNKIFNEWYRDQDLVPERAEDQTNMAQIAWEKDYYTSARPFSQKGDEITLPLGARAPIKGIGAGGGVVYDPGSGDRLESDGTTRNYVQDSALDGTNEAQFFAEEDPDNPGFPNIYADLSQAEAVNVIELRRAFALQRYQEARARYGSRYTEYLRYLGIRSSDARLQRPEYIGGGKCNISFSEVLQTGPDVQGGADSAVGDLLGHGIATCRTRKYRRYFEEHGYVMTLMSVRPKSMYINGVARHWNRLTKEDYFQKELETIGQQPVKNQEVFVQGTPDDTLTFGYADRYRDYRHQRSEVSTQFRDVFDYWHMGRKFDNLPVLNQSFVECDPTKRIHAVQTEEVLWCMVNHSLQARRMVNKSAASRIE